MSSFLNLMQRLADDLNLGIFYPPGEEPMIGAEPKLHLLIESNEESRVRMAVDELRRTLVDASMAALNVSLKLHQRKYR